MTEQTIMPLRRQCLLIILALHACIFFSTVGAAKLTAWSAIVAGLVALCALYALLKYHYKDLSFVDTRSKILMGLLLLMSLVAVFSWWWHGAEGNIRKELFYALTISIFFVVYAYRPPLIWLWLGIGAVAIAAGVLAINSVYIQGELRAGYSFLNPIPFGNLSLLAGLLCVPAMFLARTLRKGGGALIVFLLLGLFSGVFSSVLSGSRGGWVAIPFILLLFGYVYYHFFSKKIWLILTLVLSGVITFVWTSEELKFSQRVIEARDQIIAYHAGDVRSSQGGRLEMWRGALLLIQDKPLLGHGGVVAYRHALFELIKDEKINSVALVAYEYLSMEQEKLEELIKTAESSVMFEHLHNDYLDRAVKQGLVGLVALLLFYLVPIVLFSRYIRSKAPTKQALAVSIVTLIVCYAIFGLTETFLIHTLCILPLGILLMVFSAYFLIDDKAPLIADKSAQS